MSENQIRKRGRPPKQALDGESAAKNRIMETSLALFYQHGIHEVGIDRIIAESNVAKMTFYHHFSTKRDLIQAFLVLRDERYMNWVESTLDSITTDKRRRLAAMLEVMARWFRLPDFRGCAFINTTVEVGPEGQEEKIICVSHKKRLVGFISQVAKDAGYNQPHKLAENLVTVIDGATVRAQMEGPEAAIRTLNETAKILIKAYKPE